MYKFAVLASCVFLLVSSQEFMATSSVSSTNLCGSSHEIHLDKMGESSTMTVTLSPMDHDTVCTMHVTAPPTHLIYLQFVETQVLELSNDTQKHPPCVMSIFLPVNSRIPVWKGDLCADNTPTEVDLLTPDFKIIWSPPENSSFTNGRKFVLTAVGQRQVCKEVGQHACMKIGFNPEMCVSKSLVCDGFVNCPKGSTTSDEDENLCKSMFYAPKTIEQLYIDLIKRKPPDTDRNKWLRDKLEKYASSPRPKSTFFSWRDWQDVKSTESTTTTEAAPKKPPKATDSISQVLSKYGPWGYLMLGMLICGTVLMFCGLWECCFRKHKTQVEPQTPPTQPTTVLIINHQEENNPRPPNYDDLDLPPSYTTLFPNLKTNRNSSDNSERVDANNSNSNDNPTNSSESGEPSDSSEV